MLVLVLKILVFLDVPEEVGNRVLDWFIWLKIRK